MHKHQIAAGCVFSRALINQILVLIAPVDRIFRPHNSSITKFFGNFKRYAVKCSARRCKKSHFDARKFFYKIMRGRNFLAITRGVDLIVIFMKKTVVAYFMTVRNYTPKNFLVISYPTAAYEKSRFYALFL